MVLLALVAVAGYWIAQGGWQGRLIEIDRADPLSARFAVDLNRADWPELSLLPGIGETLARRIVAERTRRGRFTEPDDLLRVQGIGRRTLDRMRPIYSPCPTVATWLAHSRAACDCLCFKRGSAFWRIGSDCRKFAGSRPLIVLSASHL